MFNCLYTSALNLVINLAALPSLDAVCRTHMPGMLKSLNVTYLGRVKRGKGCYLPLNHWTSSPFPSSPPLLPRPQFVLWFQRSYGQTTWCLEETWARVEHDGTTGRFGPSSWRVSLDRARLWLYSTKCPLLGYQHWVENCPSRWELLADTAAWGCAWHFCTAEKAWMGAPRLFSVVPAIG